MAFIKVNGNAHSVDVDGDTPLLWVLRDVLGMTGTKFGCGIALCGACTVHIDGVATRTSRTILPASSTMQTLVSFTETSGTPSAVTSRRRLSAGTDRPGLEGRRRISP